MANSDETVDRQSLVTSLADRYKNQNIGGAYNANKAGTSTYQNDDAVSSKSTTFDNNPEFVVKQQLGISNFKGTEGSNYKEISDLSQGVKTSTYGDSQLARTYDKTSDFVKGLENETMQGSNFKGISSIGGKYKEVSKYGQKVGTSTYAPDTKDLSYNATKFDKTPKFFIKQPLKVTNFKGIDGNKSLKYNELSSLSQGFNNNKYKP